MIGGPLVAARAAATTLIENKPARSELALTGFSAKPYAVHDFSRSKNALTSSLTALKTHYGTAVWNSVILASQQLKPRKGSARAIVILTDGRADTTSTDVGSAVNAARASGSRVFVVIAGPGGTKQRAHLKRLADSTGGTVLNVSSIPQLRRAFTQLARTLSRQYLLSYASAIKAHGHRPRRCATRQRDRSNELHRPSRPRGSAKAKLLVLDEGISHPHYRDSSSYPLQYSSRTALSKGRRRRGLYG